MDRKQKLTKPLKQYVSLHYGRSQIKTQSSLVSERGEAPSPSH